MASDFSIACQVSQREQLVFCYRLNSTPTFEEYFVSYRAAEKSFVSRAGLGPLPEDGGDLLDGRIADPPVFVLEVLIDRLPEDVGATRKRDGVEEERNSYLGHLGSIQ
jgi:hypothetical protein